MFKQINGIFYHLKMILKDYRLHITLKKITLYGN